MAFCLIFAGAVISPWALRDNNAPVLANQSAPYMDYKLKSVNKRM